MGLDIFAYKIKLNKEEDAYFRKVNFIYKFFENQMQENQTCVVSKYEIEDLIDCCKLVLENKGDEEYAKAHLPTTSGFFFGSTEYDEDYYKSVEDCLEQMTNLYNNMDYNDLVYWVFSW